MGEKRAALIAIVTSIDEARSALQEAHRRGVAATLSSPKNGALLYGVLWFSEMQKMLANEFPTTPFTLTLDCGDRADLAHAALVEGIKSIRLGGHPGTYKAIADIAQKMGTCLHFDEES